MPAITAGTTPHRFLEIFRRAFGDVCSRVLASQWNFALDPSDEAPSPSGPVLCFQLSFSGSLQGDLAILLRGADALLIAQKLLSEAPDPSAKPSQNHRAAIEKLLQQIAELTLSGLKNTFGEIKFALSSVAPPTWEGVSATLIASGASAAGFPVKLRLSSELMANLAAVAAPAQSTVMPDGNTDTMAANGSNFDLLLNVNLNLTLRFGQCVMPLREILDMNSGSVIELDREVQEPADLLIGDKLIARGEVVIVDGNYGLRITEVADVSQRLQTL